MLCDGTARCDDVMRRRKIQNDRNDRFPVTNLLTYTCMDKMKLKPSVLLLGAGSWTYTRMI